MKRVISSILKWNCRLASVHRLVWSLICCSRSFLLRWLWRSRTTRTAGLSADMRWIVPLSRSLAGRLGLQCFLLPRQSTGCLRDLWRWLQSWRKPSFSCPLHPGFLAGSFYAPKKGNKGTAKLVCLCFPFWERAELATPADESKAKTVLTVSTDSQYCLSLDSSAGASGYARSAGSTGSAGSGSCFSNSELLALQEPLGCADSSLGVEALLEGCDSSAPALWWAFAGSVSCAQASSLSCGSGLEGGLPFPEVLGTRTSRGFLGCFPFDPFDVPLFPFLWPGSFQRAGPLSAESFPLDSSAGSVSGLCSAVSELPAPLEPTLPRENWRSLLALGAVVLSGQKVRLQLPKWDQTVWSHFGSWRRTFCGSAFCITFGSTVALAGSVFLTRSTQLIPFGGIVWSWTDGREGARK